MNLDTLSSDSSEEEIRDSGSSFYSLIVGAVIYIFHILENIIFHNLENIVHCRGGGGAGGINLYKHVCTSFILAGPCLLLPHWSVHICTITTLVNNYMEGSGSATIK